MESRCLGCMRIKQNHPVCEHCGFDERSRNNKHQLPVGTEVGGQYILGKVLGQGGFGITYIGWDTVLNQTVAVKEYFPSGYAGRDPENPTSVTSYDDQNSQAFAYNKKRFLREAESLSRLWNIPQIVKVLRCFEENGTAYIAMEYVEGMDLRRYLKQLGRPMTMDETMTILGPVMEALAHVHEANLVHRDISPDNIMVLPDGSAKLLDFGAARYVENADAEKERNSSTQAILKHGFAPPEQYSSHGALGPWTDVYAICATIYYCLTGKVPAEAMSRVVEGEKIDWNSIQGVSVQQIETLKKGMMLQPQSRYPSAQELRKALMSKSKTSISEDRASPPVPRKSGKRIWAALTALLLAAGLGLTALLLPTSKTELPEITETHGLSVPENTELTFRYVENETGITLTGYEGNLPDQVVIPDEIDGKPVTQIGSRLFYYCSDLTGITIPEGILSIDSYAFAHCSNLTSVTMPDSLTDIGNNAFLQCTGLHEIHLPASLTAIGEYAFSECTLLTEIQIPEGITQIPQYAFYACYGLTNVILPASISQIEPYAFYVCSSLSSVTLPENCKISDTSFPDFCDIRYDSYQ